MLYRLVDAYLAVVRVCILLGLEKLGEYVRFAGLCGLFCKNDLSSSLLFSGWVRHSEAGGSTMQVWFSKWLHGLRFCRQTYFSRASLGLSYNANWYDWCCFSVVCIQISYLIHGRILHDTVIRNSVVSCCPKEHWTKSREDLWETDRVAWYCVCANLK